MYSDAMPVESGAYASPVITDAAPVQTEPATPTEGNIIESPIVPDAGPESIVPSPSDGSTSRTPIVDPSAFVGR